MPISTIASGVTLLAFILGAALLPHVLGDGFTTPSNSKNDLDIGYTLGETVIISWQCSLTYITLLVVHWGRDDFIGSLMSDALNPGVYTWKIGEDDNIDEEQISISRNFGLQIRDQSNQTRTGNGFANGILSSRGFRIASNASSRTSSVSSSTPISTTSSATTVTSSPTPTSASGLSTGAKAGVGVGAGVGGIGLLAIGACLAILFVRQREKRDNHQAGTAAPFLSSEKIVGRPLNTFGTPTGQNIPSPPFPARTPNIQSPNNRPRELIDPSVVYHETSQRHELGDGHNP